MTQPNVARTYRTPQPRPAPLRSVRTERVDERAGRMLGCSPDHAQRLRTVICAEAITAILVAAHDDPSKREAFRRQCLTALSAEPAPDLTPELILEAALADAAEDVARTAALTGGMTDGERRTLCLRLRDELGAKSDYLRALEARAS